MLPNIKLNLGNKIVIGTLENYIIQIIETYEKSQLDLK